MPHPTIPQETVKRPSMSARASITRAEVTRIDEASLSQMKDRIADWGAQLNTLETEALALGGRAGSEIRQSIKNLREKYQIARLWLDEFNAAGPARWGIFRFCIQSAWSDLEMALEELRGRVVPKDSPQSDKR